MSEISLEICRDNKHIFVQVSPSRTFNDVKRSVSGVFGLEPSEFVLAMEHEESWVPLPDDKALSGVSMLQTAYCNKPQIPLRVGILLSGETSPELKEMSSPPPVPEPLQPEAEESILH